MSIPLPSTTFFFLSTAILLSPTAAGNPFRPTSDATALPPTTAGHAFPPTSDNTDFIRKSCELTRYPETCFTTLSGYSDDVHHDSGRLAHVAIRVALHYATHMANYVANMSRHVDYVKHPKSAAAVNDCSSMFGDAVDEIERSDVEMSRLGGTSDSVRFQLSNVQTWMSAALTNEDTCTDGFQGVSDGVKDDVSDRARKVKEVTSNALALVNSFANTISW